MVQDYVLGNVRIGKVANGDNAGDYFLMAEARADVRGTTSSGAKRRSNGVKPLSIQIWKNEDAELIDVVRRMYPDQGKDSEGNDWNGLNRDIRPADFNPNAVAQTLRDYEGFDWLTYDGCKVIEKQIDAVGGLYCMKYSRAMNGHAEGDWVCGADGFVQVWRTRPILVRMTEDESSYLPGWDPESRMRSQRRNLFSIAKVLAEKPELVNPIYVEGGSVVPSLNAGTAPEQHNDNR